MPKNLNLTKLFLSICFCIFAAAAAPAQSDDQPRPRSFLPFAEAPLRAATAETSMTPEEFLQLQQNGLVMRFTDGVPAYALSPLPSTTQAIRRRAQSQNPDISMEVLLALPITPQLRALANGPTENASETAAANGTDSRAITQKKNANLDLFLYNVLHRFSSMKGIEYWSASRGRMRIFYEESSVVEAGEPHRPLPDPVHSSIRTVNNLLIRQKDSSFGDNRYRVQIGSWREGQDGQDLAMLIQMVNETVMRYGIFTVAEPGGVRTELAIRRGDNVILFYATTALSVPGLPGLRDKARESFFNRLIALYTWLAGQLGIAS